MTSTPRSINFRTGKKESKVVPLTRYLPLHVSVMHVLPTNHLVKNQHKMNVFILYSNRYRILIPWTESPELALWTWLTGSSSSSSLKHEWKLSARDDASLSSKPELYSCSSTDPLPPWLLSSEIPGCLKKH